MSELSTFLNSMMEKYAGSSHTIAWTRWQSDDSPMEYLSLQNHPDTDRHLDLYFFLNHNWVEIMQDRVSLHDSTEVEGTIIVEMTEGTDWQTQIANIVEAWLGFQNGAAPWT